MVWWLIALGLLPPAGARCHDDPTEASVLPAYRAASDREVCDLPDRIVAVDARTVTVIVRPSLTRTTAAISRRDDHPETCGGPGQSHAGCSMFYARYWSRVLGEHSVEFGTRQGNVLWAADDTSFEDCREGTRNRVIATCSTAHHFAIVRYVEPDGRDAQDCYHLQLWLWADGATLDGTFEGDVERAASTGDRWVYRFPTAALAFEHGGRSAALDVAGEREECLAFRLSW